MRRETLYGVRFKGGSLALGGRGGYALFFKHKAARQFRNELIPHVSQKGRVVRVLLEWETP